MCAAGDVDGDGVPDVIVGAPGAATNGFDSGSARVFSGSDGSRLFTFDGDAAGDQMGHSVGGGGDVNGDGVPDLVAGALFNDQAGQDAGMARVYSGADGAVLYTFLGASQDDEFGQAVAIAGDVDGDGRADVIVGARREGAGTARVFSGIDGSVIYTFFGDDDEDWFGNSVSAAGDLNGDGHGDLIIGAPRDDDNGATSGSARVFSGIDGSILYTFFGDEATDFFGNQVRSAGNLDGDAVPDLVVSAPWDGSDRKGSARAFSGADGSILYTLYGDNEFDELHAVDGIGDANGDGFDDLIVSSRYNVHQAVPGYARLHSGLDGALLYQVYGDSQNDWFGHSVSGVGDVEGDGFTDVIVGASRDDNSGGASGNARILSSCPIACAGPAGSAFCFGDGSGTPCPCNNHGAASEGCANSGGSGGRLEANGTTSVAADDLGFTAMQLLAGQPALLFVGNDALNNGDGFGFGDGLRCAGTSVVRLGVDTPDALGAAAWGPGLGALGG